MTLTGVLSSVSHYLQRSYSDVLSQIKIICLFMCSFFYLFFIIYFRKDLYEVRQAISLVGNYFKILISLPSSPKYWDHRHVPLLWA